MSDNEELFDDSKYFMDPQEKNEITENIKENNLLNQERKRKKLHSKKQELN